MVFMKYILAISAQLSMNCGLAILLAGCFSTDYLNSHIAAPDWYNAGALVASDVNLLCDMHETAWVADVDHYHNLYEINPILGRDPSSARIYSYFAIILIANNLIYPKLPKWARTVWYTALNVDEAYTNIAINHYDHAGHTPDFCGLDGRPYPQPAAEQPGIPVQVCLDCVKK
jgi:hypothetical protein